MHSNRFFSTLSITLSFFLPVYGAFYTDPARLPTNSFDYVVVGGGTAGAVIANRLTENPRVTVLLLEAGPSNINVTNSIVPLLHNSLIPNTPYDWNFTTTNQVGFNGRNISFPRGHMLGGSSSVNGLVFTRGSSDDWDAYAAIAEDPSWTWENIQRYLPLIEQFTEPVEPYNITGDFIPSLHGTDGKIQTSVANYRVPLDEHIIEASQELGDEFPFNPDMGGGENVLGLGWTVSTIGRGVRSSSATGYLAPEYLSRPNLHVLVHAQVTKLIQTGTRNRLPSFHSLQFTSTLAGPRARPVTVTGRRAVVLSAGAVGTPHILQLSGIGDRSLLESVGIRTIVHNPSVGRNLSDHPLLACVYSVHDNSSYDILFREPAVFQAAMDQWNANQTGPGAASVFNQVGFFRLSDEATIFETTPDPASGPKSGHFEIMFSNFYNLPGLDAPTSGTTISFDVAVIPPTSRGSVELTSADPFAAPAIDPAYLQSEFDIFTMLEAVKAVRRFAEAQTFDGYIIEPFGEFGEATTDELLETFARGNAATVFHPVGTSSMSPKGSNWGVVDPDLRVKGVEGLFIIDAGVINKLPTAHTMAPTFIVAERGAELLKALT